MSIVDALFDRYRAAFRAGEDPDASEYLGQVSGADRRELDALIQGFLARGARRSFDADSFARFQADPLAQRILAAVEPALLAEETWPTLLPRARNERRLQRSELVARLAAALGVAAREDKVALYYHQMERGTLRPEGVSDRVLAALGEIIGVSTERLRAAGRRLAAPPAPGAGPTFARTAAPKAAPAAPPQAAAAPAEATAPAPQWDEVDQLFRGG